MRLRPAVGVPCRVCAQWTAAKKAVDMMRALNTPPGAETRRSVTELRDGAGAVLALMRQTKMDEATISCAVMWAQGLYSVHLNVKFAGRLDAPVTVLNVDNEVVSITENRVSFSGIGRQKPKRYVVELDLFDKIDANASSWSFGSVGTVRFTLRKATEGSWARLTSGSENVKNHRVWWEKQEQVDKADRDEKAAKEKAERDATKAEQEAEAARLAAEREKAEAEEKEKARLERAATRAAQKPLLDDALAAVQGLSTASIEGDASVALEGPKRMVLDAAKLLLEHESIGQYGNETAVATVEQLADAVVSLRSTGFADLTKDALASALANLNEYLEGFVVPEEELPAAKKTKAKRAKKKAAKAKKAAADK